MEKKAILAAIMLLMSAGPAFASTKFAPPPGKTILFIGQDVDSINGYLKDVGDLPGGFMAYTSLENLEGLTAESDHGGGRMHAQTLIEKYPDTTLQIGLYLVDRLKETTSGELDAQIDQLGQWIQATKRPVYLRIGYEFDLPENRYEPAAYIAAWRHIVDRLRVKGVGNVAFVWHSYAQGKAIRDWYPGDQYVDWVGASYFGQFPKFISQVAAVADEHEKPFMLAETSSWNIKNEAHRKVFFERLFKFVREKGVDALCYINANWDEQPMWVNQNWGDGRVQPYPDVLSLWQAETSKKEFLKASPRLFQTLDYRP
jgi:hypothetical protein